LNIRHSLELHPGLGAQGYFGVLVVCGKLTEYETGALFRRNP